MPNADDRLKPASPEDLADAIAFALRFNGRKRVHNADELMSAIVAKRLVEHLERSGFVRDEEAPDRRERARPLHVGTFQH
jgi:hypothetical protein